MLLAAHQLNFIPPFPYFVKLGVADIFVMQNNVQFSKSNYQNFNMIMGKKWTNPVINGDVPLRNKKYTTGQDLIDVNLAWIIAIAKLFNLDMTKMQSDFISDKTKTDRIIELCNVYGADQYIANETAPEKYLDLKALDYAGIEFVPLHCPEKRDVFSVINEMGIEKARDLMHLLIKKNKKVLCKV